MTKLKIADQQPFLPRIARRRDVLKAGLVAGAVGIAGALPGISGAFPARVKAGARGHGRAILEDDPSNIKIQREIDARRVSDDDLLFLKQIGIRWVRLQFGPEAASLELIRGAQDRCGRYGLRVYSAVQTSYQSPAIQLGLSGRDKDIETYCGFVRSLGRAGIPVASYDFHPGNTFQTATAEYHGYTTREFDLDLFREKIEKPRFDREFTADDVWAGYTYFLKAVLPVAEEAGVKLALHPDDPPVARMNGVTRVFNSYDGFRRAEKIAASPNWGILFCVGTWSEAGEGAGKSVIEMIRDFGGRGRILEVHFRNVSSALPHFYETLPDDGCVDMYAVMKALREVRYNGGLGADHIPALAGDEGRRAGAAYCLAYIKALLRRANQEVG
jgi:mannonate dehydratase